jgi:hypothetical protein
MYARHDVEVKGKKVKAHRHWHSEPDTSAPHDELQQCFQAPITASSPMHVHAIGNTHNSALMLLTVSRHSLSHTHALSPVSSLYTRINPSSIPNRPVSLSRQHAQLDPKRHLPVLALLRLQRRSEIRRPTRRLPDQPWHARHRIL